MTRALYAIFVICCCLGLLVYAGLWVFLGVLAIAAVRWLVWEHWESLERRSRRP